MKSYRPGQVPRNANDLPRYVGDELQSIARAAQRPDESVSLIYLHAEPSRIQAGDVVLADGTDWNPGSGVGMYRRNEANDAWEFVEGGGGAFGPITASGLTMNTDRLLGRSTSGTGAIEEITLGTNLSFAGTTLNAAGGASNLDGGTATTNYGGTTALDSGGA